MTGIWHDRADFFPTSAPRGQKRATGVETVWIGGRQTKRNKVSFLDAKCFLDATLIFMTKALTCCTTPTGKQSLGFSHSKQFVHSFAV